jgi:hypothetical protein
LDATQTDVGAEMADMLNIGNAVSVVIDHNVTHLNVYANTSECVFTS